MFGYTVFLKIGNLAASSLTDMYKDSYQLIGCEFGFAQGIDIKGQAQTEVKGGTFYVTYPHLPNRDMIQWMLDARKYQSGAIVVHDNPCPKASTTRFRLTQYAFVNATSNITPDVPVLNRTAPFFFTHGFTAHP